MKCHEARRQLDLFLDGELSVQENMKVLEHLNLCRPCSGVYEGEKLVREHLKEQWTEVAPPELIGRIRQKIARTRGRFRRWGGIAAMFLLGGLVTVLLVARSSRVNTSEFVNAAIRVHESSRTGLPGPGACLKPCCSKDGATTIRTLCREKLGYENCLHALDAMGYGYRSVAFEGVQGTMYCWTQQENGTGSLISHVLVRSKLIPERMQRIDRSGRVVILLSRPDGFT
jgi:anti-sigma factor (TIGR02949 family)